MSKMPNLPFFDIFDLLDTQFDLEKNKSMYFKHFLKDAQLSTILITIWTSTFNRFSQGQISGPKRSTSRELFLMSDFVRF